MREIESEAVWQHNGTLLSDMLSEVLLQRQVENVSEGVIGHHTPAPFLIDSA